MPPQRPPEPLAEFVLCDLVAREAALLDEGSYERWLELFTVDARYWVPKLGFEQASEDRAAMRARTDRLRQELGDAPVAGRCQHVLQVSRIDRRDEEAGSATLRTPFLYLESRGPGQPALTLAGSYHHVLTLTEDGLRIQLKRVDLLGADRALAGLRLIL